jgi:ABC-2 type transport system permease protein
VSALLALSLRQMLDGRRVWLLGLLLSLPVLLLLAVRLASGFSAPPEHADLIQAIFLYLLYPQSMVILVALLYGSSLLAAEIEGKTLVYLITRALPRWKVLLAKVLSTALAVAAASLASATLGFAVAGLPLGARLWGALAASTVAASFVYTAIFALLGLVAPRRAIPIGLIYAFLVELLLALVPALVNEATASYYLRSLAFQIAELPVERLGSSAESATLLRIFGGADLGQSLVALACITAVALGASALLMHRREWPLSE